MCATSVLGAASAAGSCSGVQRSLALLKLNFIALPAQLHLHVAQKPLPGALLCLPLFELLLALLNALIQLNLSFEPHFRCFLLFLLLSAVLGPYFGPRELIPLPLRLRSSSFLSSNFTRLGALPDLRRRRLRSAAPLLEKQFVR